MGSASIFALGLLPRPLLYGAGLAVVALLAALGQRQCTVMDLRKQLATERQAVDAAHLATGQCEQRERDLSAVNVRLATELQRQTAAIEQWAAAVAAAQHATNAAAREAMRAAAEDKAKADWLAGLLKQPPADCAAALARVREGLR